MNSGNDLIDSIKELNENIKLNNQKLDELKTVLNKIDSNTTKESV